MVRIYLMNSLELIICYFIIINLISFLSMGWDKRKAKTHRYRTPESVLFIQAVLGGSIGSILGMYVFRHKTKHWYFVIGMPVILVLQIALGVCVYMTPFEILFR